MAQAKSGRKQRRKGPIWHLPAEVTRKLQELCASEMPYREIAAWLHETQGLKLGPQVIFNYWDAIGRKVQAPAPQEESSSISVGRFHVTLKSCADGLDIHISPR